MKKYLVLLIALIVGSYLRFHQLSLIPSGLTWDEAAIGYNAYSILKTGRDEFGQLMPLIFKSFGDFKPGLYIYLTVPSVAIFGLTEFAVRLPSVLLGLLAIFAVYLFVKEIFSQEKKANVLGSLSALALAISPWHVHLSRGAWEVNAFSTLLLFGLYFLIRFIKGKSSIIPTLLFACTSLVCYQAAKMLTPLNYLVVIVIYWSTFWKTIFSQIKTKSTYIPLSIAMVFAIWLLGGSLISSTGNRLARLSIFGYRPGISDQTKAIDSNSSVTLNLFHNQTRLTTSLILGRYFYHFSPEVLFYEGKVVSPRGHIPDLGILHPLELIWIVAGLIYLASKWPQKSGLLILALLLIAPLPSSMTLEEFSPIRSLFMTIPLAILSGLGMYHIIAKFRYYSLPLFFIYLLVFFYSFDIYFVHAPKYTAKEFNYGYKQAIDFYLQYPGKRLVMTDVLGQPYIYYLFYTKYDPVEYQKTNHFIDGGVDVGRVAEVGNAQFHQFNTSDILTSKDTVFIGVEGDINNQFDFANSVIEKYSTINYPDGGQLFRMIKTRP